MGSRPRAPPSFDSTRRILVDGRRRYRWARRRGHAFEARNEADDLIDLGLSHHVGELELAVRKAIAADRIADPDVGKRAVSKPARRFCGSAVCSAATLA
jgi:hypothetical protein